MRLHEILNRQPAAVAFDMHRGGGPLEVTAHSDSVLLESRGFSTELPAATRVAAGVLTAADKSKLDDLDGVALQFASRAELGEAVVPTTVELLRTGGFAAPGDGGGGIYRRSAGEPGHPGKFRSADGAWWELIADARGYNALALGFVGDYDAGTNAGTDNAALLQSCADNLPTVGGANWEYGNANQDQIIAPIYFPAAQFYFGSSIELKHKLHLIGTATANPSNSGKDGGTAFVFAVDTLGITVNSHNTIDGGEDSPATTGAGGTIIEGIMMVSLGGSDPTRHGVWLRAPAELRHSVVTGFPGNGVEVKATAASADPALKGNANGSLLDHCYAYGNGGHGFNFEGNDANACAVIHCNAVHNGLWNFRDVSLLGNFFYGCHAAHGGVGVGRYSDAGNIVEYGGKYYVAWPEATEAQLAGTTPGTDNKVWRFTREDCSAWPGLVTWTSGQPSGTYRSAGGFCSRHPSVATTRAFFRDCYTEGVQPIVLGQRSQFSGIATKYGVVFGGNFEIADADGKWTYNPFTFRRYDATDDERTEVELIKADGEALRFTRYDAAGVTTGGVWRLIWREPFGDWQLCESGSDSKVAFRITGPNTNYPESYRLAAEKILIGKNTVSAGLTTSPASGTGANPPTSGEYLRGDVLFAPNPKQGDFAGMICTTAGTAGSTAVFHGFGQVGVTRNTTASRPTLGTDKSGYMYFDTTLAAAGKPIWWTGTDWVDATGATV